MFFKKCLYFVACFVTKIFGLERWTLSSGNPDEEIVHYFFGFGRKMLIYHGKEVVSLGNSLNITARRKKNGKLIDCKFSRHMLEPGDQIIFGYMKVYEKYNELTFMEHPLTGGMEIEY